MCTMVLKHNEDDELIILNGIQTREYFWHRIHSAGIGQKIRQGPTH